MARTKEEIRKANEEALAAKAKARAESDPMLNPTVRPEATQDRPGYVRYYGWIGGASNGRWKLYEVAEDTPQAVSAAQRSVGGQTQATFTSAVGSGTVIGPSTSSAISSDALYDAKRAAGYGIDAQGNPITISTVASDGSNTYKFVGGILLFNGQAYSGEYEGKTYKNGRVVTPTSFSTGDNGGNNGNGGSTGGLTQADIDAAVAKAVAGATAANNAMIAQMKAEADAAKLATKQKASDKLTALFSAYGLETLAPFINTRIMADVSEEMLLLELYDRPEYQKRFPGMSSLRKKSRTITEKEYMDIEKAMTQTARFFDLPKGFYDNPDDFGKLIGAEVSAKEYQDRLQVGQDLSRTLNPSVKQQLIDFYGVGEGDLTAFVLDADKALPLIQKQAKAAQFVGIGRAAGFELRGITSGQAENIAGTESYAKLSERELAQALGQAGQLRRTQKRLSGIEGQDYSEQEALSAVIEGSPQALLASQQRAQREGARFSARGGVTGASLRSTATPI
jgi:hypothetical protein